MEKFYEKDGITIYQRDNLEVLRKMESGTVNLIYCDILYNTGKVFDDYNDNLGSALEAVEWYRPRFEEMKRVLAENGSIFIHCNWRLDSYMRILLDEIFGEKCFRNRIYRKHSEERGFFANFDSQMDIILYYVKNPENFVYHETRKGKPTAVALYENGYMRERSEVRYLHGNVIDLGYYNKHWLVSPAQFEKMVQNDDVILIVGMPFRFINVVPIGNLWNEPEMLDTYTRTSSAEAYDTPKPEAVLERIIRSCSNEGDLVADFFMGGGTTAVVAKKMNRKGIFCDISPKACKIAVKKLEQI